MKKLLLLLLCVPLLVFSQEEKRLGLVIGNANYDKGELKNPVNDALVITETLKKLEFDVILDTNLADKRSFIETIRKFGNKRPDYDVAFVYYAGHGIQVGSENYLLPTKEVFESEYDVKDYGVSVQDIMRYLSGMSNQVNILILDACRDNPFEGNWNATRSLKGSGLAKIPPPTGSLIAFSTDAGNTASDGDGINTVYCESLCKNMLKENTSLDQVFRNVRADVLKQTDGNQRPVEASQLTGTAFYLVKSSYEKEFDEIMRFQEQGDFTDALEILAGIIAIDSLNIRAYYNRAEIYSELGKYYKALDVYNRIISFDSEHPQFDAYVNRGIIYSQLNKYDEAIADFNKSLEIDTISVPTSTYYYRGKIFFSKKDYKNALADFNTVINLDTLYLESYIYRGRLYLFKKKYENALEDFNKVIKLNSKIPEAYYYKALVYKNTEKYDKALTAFEELIKISPKDKHAYLYRAKIYHKKGFHEKEKSDYLKAIEIDDTHPEAYYYLALLYLNQNQVVQAERYFTQAISLCLSNSGYSITSEDWMDEIVLSNIFLKRGEIYKNRASIKLMCEDYKEACDLGNCEMFDKHCK